MYTLNIIIIYSVIKIVSSEYIYTNLKIPNTINVTDNKSEMVDSIYKCEQSVCLQKCCPVDQYVIAGNICKPHNKTSDFSDIYVYDNTVKTDKTIKEIFHLLPGLFVKNEELKEHYYNMKFFPFNDYVQKNGDLWLEMPNAYNKWTKLNQSQFCLDYTLSKKGQWTSQIWANVPPEDIQDGNIYLTVGTLVSCVFMVLVLIVYALLPELRNLCGMVLMAYVFSLFWAFLLLAIIQLDRFTKHVCIALSLLIYFSFLASFCWMNIMSYDIWWTFRGYAKARPIHRRGEKFKFLMYCLYAWGVPLLMMTALGVLNETEMRHIPWFVKPQIPLRGCFIDDGVKLLYLYIPMLIMIMFNWMFYLMTAYNVWRLSRGTAVLSHSSASGTPSAHRTQRHRLMLYLKLSIVMGLSWVFEVISSLWPNFKLWYISDTYNMLLGLAIFLIFVCKRQILRKLKKRYQNKRMSWHPSSKSYSSNSDSSSNHETTTFQISTNPKGV